VPKVSSMILNGFAVVTLAFVLVVVLINLGVIWH
jgi:hypothetical protein